MKGEEKLWAILNEKLDNLRATNRLPQAIRVAETALEVARRAFKGNQTALATSFDRLGQSEEAIDFYQKAIAAGTEVDDVPYSDIGTMLNNVALILRKSGRQKAAEPCYLRALEIYEKQLGPDHADVASVLNNLAVFYTNERRYTEAERI